MEASGASITLLTPRVEPAASVSALRLHRRPSVVIPTTSVPTGTRESRSPGRPMMAVEWSGVQAVTMACPYDLAYELSRRGKEAHGAEEMVEAAGVGSNDENPLSSSGQGRLERKLEIRGILGGRMSLHRRAVPDRIVEYVGVHRVHVTDHKINGEAEFLGMVQAAVSSDHVGVVRKIELAIDLDRFAAR